MEFPEKYKPASILLGFISCFFLVVLSMPSHMPFPIYGRGGPITYLAVVWSFFLCLAIGVALICAERKYGVLSRFIPSCSAKNLALIRIVASVGLLIAVVKEDLVSIASIPAESYRLVGMMNLLTTYPSLFSFLSQEWFLWVVTITLYAGLFGSLVGYRTKASLALVAVAYLFFGGFIRLHTVYFHIGLIPYYVLLVLLFSPCHHAFAIDKVSSNAKRAAAQNNSYGVARYACWIMIVVPYVLAGIAKLRASGWDWFDPQNVRAQLFEGAYKATLHEPGYVWYADWLLAVPGEILFVFGVAAIVIELGCAFALFSQRGRAMFPLGIALLQGGILVVMGIPFLGAILLQSSFFNWFREPRESFVPASPKKRTAVSSLTLVGFFIIVSLLLFPAFTVYEYYPVSSWTMFSIDRGKDVVQLRYFAVFEDGSRLPLDLSHWSRSFGTARFTHSGLYRCQPGPKYEACVRVFKKAIDHINKQGIYDQRIVGVVRQQLTFPFGQDRLTLDDIRYEPEEFVYSTVPESIVREPPK